jgi:hypothetical protein
MLSLAEIISLNIFAAITKSKYRPDAVGEAKLLPLQNFQVTEGRKERLLVYLVRHSHISVN